MRVILILGGTFMATYNTSARKRILSFLKEHAQDQYTIEEIIQKMDGEHLPGKSTVYRQMDRLVRDGLVRRAVQGESRHFLYQFSGGEDCETHLHLRCTDCGKLFHMGEKESQKILEEIRSLRNFSVDREKTVLLGRCGRCMKEKSKK